MLIRNKQSLLNDARKTDRPLLEVLIDIRDELAELKGILAEIGDYFVGRSYKTEEKNDR